jgi:hypothetical protein
MRRLSDFQNDEIKNLEKIKASGFIHTQIPGWFGAGYTDCYYDKNNNGICDDAERGSLTIAYVSNTKK